MRDSLRRECRNGSSPATTSSVIARNVNGLAAAVGRARRRGAGAVHGWFESGLVVTARDLARIGELVLDGGKVGDRDIAPAWVARSVDPAGRATATTFGDHTLVAMGKCAHDETNGSIARRLARVADQL